MTADHERNMQTERERRHTLEVVCTLNTVLFDSGIEVEMVFHVIPHREEILTTEGNLQLGTNARHTHIYKARFLLIQSLHKILFIN